MVNRVLRLRAVVEKSGTPKATIYFLMKRGLFPRPIKISSRSVAWLESEIDQWLASRPRSK